MTEDEIPYRTLPGPLSVLRSFVIGTRLALIKIRLGKKLRIGRNVRFGKGADLHPASFARFGDNVAVARDFFLEANLEAGSDILISSKVAFVGNDHRFEDPTKTIFWSGRFPESTIYLEGDNLIGFGVVIVGNVRIGRGCIIGAGAVVTKDLPPNTVCVGIPAKPIRKRFSEDNSLL